LLSYYVVKKELHPKELISDWVSFSGGRLIMKNLYLWNDLDLFPTQQRHMIPPHPFAPRWLPLPTLTRAYPPQGPFRNSSRPECSSSGVQYDVASSVSRVGDDCNDFSISFRHADIRSRWQEL